MNRSAFYDDNDESDPLIDINPKAKKLVGWDKFKNTPRISDSGSTAESKWIDLSVQVLKVVTYIVVFVVVLGCAIVSKGTLLLFTSQINGNVTRRFCNINYDTDRQFVVHIPIEERVLWIWIIIFSYFIPQLGTFIRSVRICIFKSWGKPNWTDFFQLLITECLPAIGSAILVFIVLPELDVVKGAMLTNAFCFIPLCVGFLSRDPKSEDVNFKMILDITCIVAQASAFVMWPIIEGKPILYFIPISIILISLGWWENFVSKDAKLQFLKKLGEKNRVFKSTTYYYYSFISVINALVFFCTTLLIIYFKDGEIQFLFDNFKLAFSAREMNITEIMPIIWEDRSTDLNDVIELLSSPVVTVDNSTYVWLFLINIATTYLCYAFGKFACKVMIQGFSFAFAINMAVPALLSGLISMSGNYDKDECAFWNTIPEYLFFNTPGFYFLDDFLFQRHSWIWLIWLLSQAWVTIHIWSPKCEKLARTEHLFFRPMYDAFLIDQSLAMNRRRDDEVDDDNTLNNEEDIIKERIKRERSGDDQPKEPIKPVTRIYACATMWHESKEEMSEFLKSVMRLDEDQCAHKLAKYVYGFDVPYYELETNIYFDDAFVREDKDDDDPLLNSYVKDTIPSIEKAASDVHGVEMKLRPPYIYSTPYGGRLEWILPGRTKLIIHMKDKKKIRNKKRWSQCMYMYQLLGHRLMDNDQINPEDILGLSHNTYILALDGDIDFQPEALHLLVEYMKKNGNLGAACGRIHPVGAGAIAWYQVFEYAVGHWLQKATEHVIGCVLCSPGCFSLFRARALMEDRVMCKYTTRASEARHYVQYDQGEDRWLCTLLLQEGFRVEYSAASDAYTHCPESFNEFYNQRRRWMPSTMANIMDLLGDYKHVVKRNDNISMLYIFYQIILLIGTIIGPGTIFLMLVGGFVSVFSFDQWHSLLFNGVPIIIFTLVCATCKSDTQLLFAGILSAIYGLIMMAVMIGVVLQIRQDGILAPSSVFFFFLAGEFIVAALLHPKEFYCLKYGVIYYVTVPSMYMLLVIYSVFNMNNVSWGTRDVSVLPTKKVEEEEVDGVKEKPKEVTTTDKVLSFFGANQKDDEGSVEFSCAGLFKCLFCTHAKEENTQLLAIQESIALLSKKLDSLEENSDTPSSSISVKILKGDDATPAKPTVGKGKSPPIYQAKSDDDIIRNSWFYDELLQKGEVKFLQHKEEKFWKMLIDKYLHPIDDTENKPKVEKELKDLRDQMVFTFYMLNSLFVLVIFLLTLQKDIIHINWPFNPSENFTYIPDQNEIYIYKDYLHLEPIGFVFLIFFALLLVIQSFGMFLHRFGTFSQIICNTSIAIPFVKKDIKNSVDDLNQFTKESAIKLIKALQQLRKKDTIDENTGPGRKSVAAIALQKVKDPQIYDLEEAFHARLNNRADATVPKKTMMQLDKHMDHRKSLAVIKHQDIALNASPDPISTIPMYVDDGTFA